MTKAGADARNPRIQKSGVRPPYPAEPVQRHGSECIREAAIQN
jgi:hypothetical protein